MNRGELEALEGDDVLVRTRCGDSHDKSVGLLGFHPDSAGSTLIDTASARAGFAISPR